MAESQRRIPRQLKPARAVPMFTLEAEEAEWYGQYDTYHVPTFSVMETDDRAVQPSFGLVALRLFRKEIQEIQRRAAALDLDIPTYVRLLINHHLFEELPLGEAPGDEASMEGQKGEAAPRAAPGFRGPPVKRDEVYEMLGRFVLRSAPDPEPPEDDDEAARTTRGGIRAESAIESDMADSMTISVNATDDEFKDDAGVPQAGTYALRRPPGFA